MRRSLSQRYIAIMCVISTRLCVTLCQLYNIRQTCTTDTMSTKSGVVSRKRTNSLKVDVKTVTGVAKVAATAVVDVQNHACKNKCQRQTVAVDAAAEKTCLCKPNRRLALCRSFSVAGICPPSFVIVSQYFGITQKMQLE